MNVNTGYQQKTGRIAFLDFLRIVAFSSVLIGHNFYDQAKSFAANSSIHATPRLLVSWALPLSEAGGAGVVIFFLISGYIISQVLARQSTCKFLFKRIFRIYPLYMAAVLMQVIYQWRIASPIPFSVLGPQLLLIGDFFATPYSLGGVEWTLRIEMIFYVLMALLQSLGLMHNRAKWLPWILSICLWVLALLPPLPISPSWSKGYINLYAPFLVFGIFVDLYERRRVQFIWLAYVGLIVCGQYFFLIGKYQPSWLNAHFAILALALFLVSWALRNLFIVNSWILFLSSLTYGVYLFHLWTWRPMGDFLQRVRLPWLPVDLQRLVLLLSLCLLMSYCVERPAIRFAEKLLQHWSKRFSQLKSSGS